MAKLENLRTRWKLHIWQLSVNLIELAKLAFFFSMRLRCVHGDYMSQCRLTDNRAELQEFPARELAYYEEAHADGRLRVTGWGKTFGLRDPLKNGMQIMHYIHRHEPPVLDVKIPVCPQNVLGVLALCQSFYHLCLLNIFRRYSSGLPLCKCLSMLSFADLGTDRPSGGSWQGS